MTSMRARVLNLSGVLVLCSAIAASTATSTTAGPANRTGTTTANRTAASAAARLTAARAAASLASPQQLQAAVARHAAGYRVMSHPGALTDAERARVNRYWTAARMANAQPPGPVQVVAVPAAVPGWAAGAAMAGPNPISVRGKATAAGWPGGGTVSRTTGKVFFTMDAQDYVCSAAVVTSANSNVVITAAHCVKDGNGSWAGNWEFVPGFGYGDRRPYGTWTASHFFVPGQWSHGRDDNDDVAFVTLSPKQVSGRTMDIGQVVGGQNIALRRSIRARVCVRLPCGAALRRHGALLLPWANQARPLPRQQGCRLALRPKCRIKRWPVAIRLRPGDGNGNHHIDQQLQVRDRRRDPLRAASWAGGQGPLR